MKKLLLFLVLFALPAFGQLSSTGNITITGATCAVTNACISLNLSNTPQLSTTTATITLSGTFTGTFSFEASADNGTTFLAIPGTPLAGGAAVTSATAAGTWTFSISALTQIRVRASAAVTGTAVVTIQASPGIVSGVTTSVYLASAYTNTTTTPSNLTDGTNNMAFSVAANKNYRIRCDLIYQGSATTAGLEMKVTGPASPTAVNITYDNWISPTLPHNDSQVAFAGTLGTSSAIVGTTNLGAHLWIYLENGANSGTVQMQALSAGAGTVTVQPGSGCWMVAN